MSENVVPLNVACRPVQSVDSEVVALLERLLENAKGGNIQGVIIATVESDGAGSVLSVGTCWAGEGVKQNVHAGIGAIAYLQSRFINERMESP